MKLLAFILAALCALSVLACNGGDPEPTANNDGPVAAAVRATIGGDATLSATVEARVAVTLAAQDPSQAPRPVATLGPTATLTPTSPLQPATTATPLPTPLPTSTTIPEPAATQAPGPTETPVPVQTLTPPPAPTLTPGPTRKPLPTVSPGQWKAIQNYAARMAGGPGAIYVGDLSQMVGPAPYSNL